MPSEKQIDTVARMLDPDAFAFEKTMLLMKGEMFGHHGDRVRAARGKAEELLTAAEQAEPFEERILTDEECAMLDAAWERHRAAKPKFLPTEDGEFNGNEQAEPARVKVKELEWEERVGVDGTFDAYTSIGHHIATITDDGRGLWFAVGLTQSNYCAPDIDIAKAAAQADYERRILAALEPAEPAAAAEPYPDTYSSLQAVTVHYREMHSHHPTPSEARLREALFQIDALDPEGRTAGFSVDALRGLIERMGAIARAALKESNDEA